MMWRPWQSSYVAPDRSVYASHWSSRDSQVLPRPNDTCGSHAAQRRSLRLSGPDALRYFDTSAAIRAACAAPYA